MNPLWFVLIALAVGGVSFFVARMVALKSIDEKIQKSREESKKIIQEGEKDAAIRKKEAGLEAREEWLKIKDGYEKEIDIRRRQIETGEKKLDEKQADLNKRMEFVEVRDRDLVNRDKVIHVKEKGIELREGELNKIISDQNDKLQKIAQMTPEEAKKQLMENMTSIARMEAAAHIKEIKETAEKDADKEAKEIILRSIYRCAAEHSVESTVSVVQLPSDEMKGRIIGREGRNIRSFETLTGVDVIVDDTPEAVILSGYDPVRRQP